MDRPVMFNGRLNKDELDTWLDLLDQTSESGFKDRQLAKVFLMLQESITFVSSLESRIIGGTSIYRDRTRLAMVLASVAVKREFRESATYQIIKSSMPFFKTVAIRDVDALVSQDYDKNTLGFPLSFEMDPWTSDIIKRIGFSEVGTLYHYTLEIEHEMKKNAINWTGSTNTEEVRELIWDQSRPMGLTNSLVWLARDFALNRKCLSSAYVDEQIVAIGGFWNVEEALCVSPFVSDPEKIGWDMLAESLFVEAMARGVKQIELPLIGEGQKNLIETLERMCSVSSCRKLSLLRKPL